MPHYYSTTKNDLRYKGKPQKVVNKTANQVSYLGVHPDDAMKTERIDCVCIKNTENCLSRPLYNHQIVFSLYFLLQIRSVYL